MGNLKSLAKDTVIYGMSSIVGRFLNYLLVPLYTAKLSAASGGYGVITNLYAWTALLLVILTFGMETTLFRFANKSEENPKKVYGTALTAVACVAMAFLLVVLGFLPYIAQALGYAEHPSWVAVMAIIVAMDALQAIPFAYLRYQKRAIKFAALKLAFIVFNVTLNLLYFVVFPALKCNVLGLYDAQFTLNVGFAFYINFVCTGAVMLLFYQELAPRHWTFSKALFKRMWDYSRPLLALGIAGTLNQSADKMLFPIIYTAADCQAQLGIYGAAVKIAMIMALITQAFRYAYEPFVFSKSAESDNKETYAQAMKYFIIFTLAAFLAVMAWIEVFKYVIAPDYWDGLKVVPIVMAAEIMMGIYFNLSFWYKLTDRTSWGAILSFSGFAALLAVNFAFVPQYGYMACAWGGFAGYAVAMVLCYFTGQKFYPIAYPLREIAIYILAAGALYALMELIPVEGTVLVTLLRSVLLVAFLALIWVRERRHTVKHSPNS